MSRDVAISVPPISYPLSLLRLTMPVLLLFSSLFARSSLSSVQPLFSLPFLGLLEAFLVVLLISLSLV